MGWITEGWHANKGELLYNFLWCLPYVIYAIIIAILTFLGTFMFFWRFG